MNDNETTNLAFGTAAVVDDANQGAANELLITAESGAVTIAGTPADDDLTFFEFIEPQQIVMILRRKMLDYWELNYIIP